MTSTSTMFQALRMTAVQRSDDKLSTLDSEALLNSDDDSDRQDTSLNTQHQQKPISRVTQPTASQPRENPLTIRTKLPSTTFSNTLSTEPGIWTHQTQAKNMGRGHPRSSTFPWDSGIWNNDSKNESSRLSEVLSSPNLRGSPLSPSNGLYSDTEINLKDLAASPTIPFAIPLHPTPKTYRSQSYSVGQLDPDSPSYMMNHINLGPSYRVRNLQHSGLQHRPSKPSMLSEISNEGCLGNLRELDGNGDEKIENTMNGLSLSNGTRAGEAVTQERAPSHQQKCNLHLHPEFTTNNVFSSALCGTLPEGLDSAIDEFDDPNESLRGGSVDVNPIGRFGGISASGRLRVATLNSAENRKLEDVKKAFWQSSLGFGGLSDISQSRRHSFADIPTKHTAIERITEPFYAQDLDINKKDPPEEYLSSYREQNLYSFNENSGSYLDGTSKLSRNSAIYNSVPYYKSSRPRAVQSSYSGVRTDPIHKAIFNNNQSRQIIRQTPLLTIVLFKSSRAEIFCIQDGIDLRLNPGDLVIVEADRGTDLGTVARADIDWPTAKKLQDYYSQEHYKWLTMYSRTLLRSSDDKHVNTPVFSGVYQGNTSGNVGSPTQLGTQEVNVYDMKRKMIKRLAQKHDIQSLREKEGSEAKAKHVCMQRVKEHGLKMEILDAEFQMDSKKLTFYYFADAYINFTSLVTDLFKIYKTRIWMSAINPASFASSSYSQIPKSIAPPGALNLPITKNIDRHHSPRALSHEQKRSSCGLQATWSYQDTDSQPYTPTFDRSIKTLLVPPYTYGSSPYVTADPANCNISSNAFLPVDSFTGFPAQLDFQRRQIQFSYRSPNVSIFNDDLDPRQSSIYDTKDSSIKGFQRLFMDSR